MRLAGDGTEEERGQRWLPGDAARPATEEAAGGENRGTEVVKTEEMGLVKNTVTGEAAGGERPPASEREGQRRRRRQI